jgi:two-component sensor histidine kinase
VYRSRKDFENAIRYYKLSLVLKQENQDEKGILNTFINIGSAYQNNNQFDSALAYAEKANELAKTLQLENDILAAESNMAAALVNLKRLEEAFPLLSAAETKAIATGEKKSLLTIYETYGDALRLKGRLPEAENMYQKGLAIASGNKRREYMEVYYRKLATLNHTAGNDRAAFDFAEKGRRIKDSLWNEENSRQINEMSAVYETAEKEKQIETLNIEKKLNQTELQQRKRERNYFILSSFLLLGIAGVSYLGYSTNKKKKNVLNKQNAVIEQQLSEKEYLLKEIHHRVKNNLQVVSSLLSLQSRYIRDELALDAVKDSRNRVHAMAMIHQNLYKEDNLTGIDIRDYITRLCQNLFQSYNIHESRIRLYTAIDALIMDVDLVIPLGLILNELITNSLKYAFPYEREGELQITLRQTNNQIILTVKDNGIGFPENTLTEKKDSLGSKLIQAFVQKLKGNMKAYNQDGAIVEINFNHTGIQKT